MEKFWDLGFEVSWVRQACSCREQPGNWGQEWKLSSGTGTHSRDALQSLQREGQNPPHPPPTSQVGTNRRTAGLGASAHKASQGSSYLPPVFRGLVISRCLWWFSDSSRKFGFSVSLAISLTSCNHPRHHPPLWNGQPQHHLWQGSLKGCLPIPGPHSDYGYSYLLLRPHSSFDLHRDAS